MTELEQKKQPHKPHAAKKTPKPVAKSAAQVKKATTVAAKSIKIAPVDMVEVVQPQQKASLTSVIIGVVLIVIAILALRQPQLRERLKAIELPEINLPDASGWFATSKIEKQEEELPPAPEPAQSKDAEEDAKLKQQLLDAEARIEQLQETIREKDQALERELNQRGRALLAQYARLIEFSLEQGQVFTYELEQLERFSTDMGPEIEKLIRDLRPYSMGVASDTKLQEEFDIAATEMRTYWLKEESGGGVRATLARMLNQIISIRKVGAIKGESADAAIARAEYHMEQHELAKAVAEIEALSGGYRAIAKDWLEIAHNRLAAKQLIKAMRAFAEDATPPVAAPQQEEPAPAAQDEAGDLAVPPTATEAVAP